MTDVWTMQSREDEIEYCRQHGIDLPFSADSSYSRDRNLWHISHEGLELEDPANEPNYDHLLENRVVGMKSRGVYETPGGTILMEAHQQLEELVLDRDTTKVKKDMGNLFSQIVYEGKWFTPLREAVQAFIESTQEYVTGEVKFKLYKGNIIKAGTTSPYSLYSESLASFTTGELYDHHDADGFINLFGLPLKVRAMKMAEIEKNQ